uniref:Beaded filament structural protein 2, phakinin n=1 Tax=Fundulus heteroclitus TaxID=8078 RepID=A0A3Q2Q0H1_FUNHE
SGLAIVSTNGVQQPVNNGHTHSTASRPHWLTAFPEVPHRVKHLHQVQGVSCKRKSCISPTWTPGVLMSHTLQVSEAILDNARLMLQTENVQANAEDFKERYENEQPFRRAVEEEISSLHRVIEEANMTKVELEEQMENMRAELHSLENNYEQDVHALYNQMAGREVDEPDAPTQTSLDQILAYIRGHWEKVMERNRAQTDGCLECKVRDGPQRRLLPPQVSSQVSSQVCLTSMSAVGSRKRGLENSLGDARHWHGVELQNLGSLVAKLEAELNDVRSEMDQQRRDYDTLLSNRQRLEQEIRLYHGVLDGEESRLLPADAPCNRHCTRTRFCSAYLSKKLDQNQTGQVKQTDSDTLA